MRWRATRELARHQVGYRVRHGRQRAAAGVGERAAGLMRQLIALGRGLVHRAGAAAMILVVAVVAAAAAAAGPVYYQAALHSILASDMSSAPILGRGFEATTSGPINGTLASLRTAVTGELDHDLGVSAARRIFEPPIESIDGSYADPARGQTFLLAWR